MTKRKKTSIKVDDDLWRRFGAQLTLEGIDYSSAIESMIRERLGTKVSVAKHKGPETEVLGGLRRWLRKDQTALLTIPPLLGVGRETMAEFMQQKCG